MSLTQRVKLAQELHDGIAQDLVGLGYAADSLIAQESDETKRHSLRAMRFDINTLIERVRIEILELRASSIKQEPLNSTDDLHSNLDRIFNEVLNNAIKHSRGSTVEISIKDNGVGGALIKENHYGISGLTERVDALGGKLHIESDAKGTRVMISVPLARQ